MSVYSIELYKNSHEYALLNIFRMNVPEYFADHEEQDLLMYLHHHADNFYVCKLADLMVGCGGHNIDGNTGKLFWYIVHPDFQHKGVGSVLVNYNMDALKQKGFTRITVRTSQMADKFYEKFGFKLLRTQKDFWARGIDLYEMELKR